MMSYAQLSLIEKVKMKNLLQVCLLIGTTHLEEEIEAEFV